ncbi:MAG: outer membrane lipoprotein-sorting protein [Myxococcota bacterium]|jgi:hypothetical protein|nr:outer membrane lipoprotein-sorting protein [Myxococcota bacterium]
MSSASPSFSTLLMLLVAVSLTGFPAQTSAQDAASVPSRTLDEILDCAAANAPERTARQEFRLLVHDRGGGAQTLEATLHWKLDEKGNSKILAELSAPPDLRGSAVLMIEREGGTDMFAYLPELRLVRRVTGRHSEGSVFGSDFSYRDMEQLYHAGSRGSARQLADSTHAGRPVHVVESRAAEGDDSAYRKGVARIDKETCVALESVFYESEDEVRKTLTADAASLVKSGKTWLPHHMRIEDRKTATFTELVVDRVEFDVDVPDRLFTRSSLERRGR